MAAYVLSVNGTPRTIDLPSLDFQFVANGRDVLNVVVTSADGAFRPTLGHEVLLSENGTNIFGGVIAKTAEAGVNGLPIAHIATEITCDAFNVYADRRFVTETFAAGSTLESILATLVTTYLADFGVTLHASQATGPTFADELVFDGESLSSVLQTLSELAEDAGTGESWLWEISPAKVFLMFEAGSVAAPINFVAGDGHEHGDITVVRSRAKYANRVIVKYGDNRVITQTDSFTGNGVLDTFTLTYPIQGPVAPTSAGAVGYATVDHLGGESLGGLTSPMIWRYDPAALTILRTTGAVGNGVGFTVDYDVQFPQTVTVEDAGEITAHGPHEIVLTYPQVFDLATATGLATAALAKLLATVTEVSIPTYEVGLLPGQTATVTQAARNVSGDFLITEVRARSTPAGLLRTLLAVSGTVFRGSFRDVYRAWAGGGAGSAVASSGPSVSTGSAGVGTVVAGQGPYFLGGSLTEYVQDPTPTWTPASAVEIAIDTALRGTTSATVRARLRATAGNVTARLRNITDGATVGTSAVVSSASWTDAHFAVVLTSGAKVYRLELLPSLSDTDTSAVAYLE